MFVFVVKKPETTSYMGFNAWPILKRTNNFGKYIKSNFKAESNGKVMVGETVMIYSDKVTSCRIFLVLSTFNVIETVIKFGGEEWSRNIRYFGVWLS